MVRSPLLLELTEVPLSCFETFHSRLLSRWAALFQGFEKLREPPRFTTGYETLDRDARERQQVTRPWTLARSCTCRVEHRFHFCFETFHSRLLVSVGSAL